LDDFGAKSWFGPSQTCTVGDFLLYPKISENFFFHYKSFLTIIKRSSTARNVISSPLDAPKGACLAIGQNPVLGDFGAKSWFGPSQTCTVGDFLLYPKIFENYFFH